MFTDGKLLKDDRTFAVLADNDTIEKANLKQTSLYRLAQRLGLEPERVIRHFIDYENYKSREVGKTQDEEPSDNKAEDSKEGGQA